MSFADYYEKLWLLDLSPYEKDMLNKQYDIHEKQGLLDLNKQYSPRRNDGKSGLSTIIFVERMYKASRHEQTVK